MGYTRQQLTVGMLPARADLDWLHDQAHKEYFIANSVTTEVHVVGASKPQNVRN
jgi:hypothetical protein